LCCSVAMYLRLCEGTTRSSWSAVSSNTAGYPDEPAESSSLWATPGFPTTDVLTTKPSGAT
jgi:hypothetical protein